MFFKILEKPQYVAILGTLCPDKKYEFSRKKKSFTFMYVKSSNSMQQIIKSKAPLLRKQCYRQTLNGRADEQTALKIRA